MLKTKEIIATNNIDVKQIPIKILVPFLEMASLEEDEVLQDKWAKMLANMANSSTNLQNQIFPYILSQISIEEFDALKKLDNEEISVRQTISRIKELQELKKANTISPETDFYKELAPLYKERNKVEQDGFQFALKDYEKANILRLGLARQLPPKIYIEEFSTGGERSEGSEQWHSIGAEYEADEYGFRITELGQLFLKICEIKEKE